MQIAEQILHEHVGGTYILHNLRYVLHLPLITYQLLLFAKAQS